MEAFGDNKVKCDSNEDFVSERVENSVGKKKSLVTRNFSVSPTMFSIFYPLGTFELGIVL